MNLAHPRMDEPRLGVVADIPAPKLWAAAGLQAGLLWLADSPSLPMAGGDERYDPALRMSVPVGPAPTVAAKLLNVLGVEIEIREISVHNWLALDVNSAAEVDGFLAKARLPSAGDEGLKWAGLAFAALVRGAGAATSGLDSDNASRWRQYIDCLETDRYAADVLFDEKRQHVALFDKVLQRHIVNLWDDEVDLALDEGYLAQPPGNRVHSAAEWLVPLTDYAIEKELLVEFRHRSSQGFQQAQRDGG